MKRFFAAICLVGAVVLAAGCEIADQKGAVPVNAYVRLPDDIDVRSKGLAGDGVSDDTEALNRIIDESEESGKRLYFPKGTYRIEGSAVLPSSLPAVFAEGATVHVVEGGYLVFNGPVEAGNYRIFRNDGTLKINSSVRGNPFWFGAAGDGKTDDTAAFEAAFRVFSELSLPPAAEGYVLGELKTFKNMRLSGEDPERKTVIKAAPGTKRMFYTDAGHFTVENIRFEMAAAPTASTVFYFDTAKAYIEKVYVDRCDFYDAFHVFTDARSDHVMMFMYFTNLNFVRGRSSIYLIEDFEGFIFLKNIKADFSESYKHHNLKDGFPAIQIDDVRGTIFENMEIVGGNSGFASETGFFIPGKKGTMASVWWDRVEVRDMGGYGVELGPTYICSFVHTRVSNCGGGIRVTKADELQMHDVTVENNRASGESPAHGIWLSGSLRCQLNEVTARGNAGNGIELQNCDSVTVIGARLNDNEGIGYRDRGGNRNLFALSEATGNRERQIAVDGSGGIVRDAVTAKNGKALSFTGPGKSDR